MCYMTGYTQEMLCQCHLPNICLIVLEKEAGLCSVREENDLKLALFREVNLYTYLTRPINGIVFPLDTGIGCR